MDWAVLGLPAVLEARDDGADEATLDAVSTLPMQNNPSSSKDSHTWTPSGLIAMKLQNTSSAQPNSGVNSPPSEPRAPRPLTHVCSVDMAAEMYGSGELVSWVSWRVVVVVVVMGSTE